MLQVHRTTCPSVLAVGIERYNGALPLLPRIPQDRNEFFSRAPYIMLVPKIVLIY
jgi:hypothetical protein